MKKLIAMSVIFFALITVTACTKTEINNEVNDNDLNQEVILDDVQNLDESMDSINELTESENNGENNSLKGSCDTIDDSSACIEFYGSIWNEQTIKLSCEGTGTYSAGSCPQDMSGGCNTGVGTIADAVSWFYTRGGGEITPESLQYAEMACNATLDSKWVLSR